MIAHLNIPGQNLQIAYEFLANHAIRLFLYKSIHAANSRSLAACHAYFTAQYQLNDRDVIARLVINENSANEILISRQIQGQFIEDSINEREQNIFLANRERVDRMIAVISDTELKA